MAGPTFTVFTATFNRAHTIGRVHESLRAQTFRDFEWVIVDDGSQDGTRERVAGWSPASPFPIRYFWQANAGKAAATNRGVAEARGELFLIVDSDDAFVPSALARFWHHWQSIPAAERGRYTGVTALSADERGRLVGDPFPRDVLDGRWGDIHYRYGIRGDKWGFHRTDVLRRFPFPVEPGAHHVPEDVVWRAISREYLTRYVNEVLLVYHQHEGPRLTRVSPREWARFRRLQARRLSEDRRWFRVAPLQLARLAVHYARFSFLAGDPVRTQVAALEGSVPKLLWAAAAPLGLALSWRDRLRERVAERRRSSPAPAPVR
jgi:glycosyltransferase involved in cell wall biosynthesis